MPDSEPDDRPVTRVRPRDPHTVHPLARPTTYAMGSDRSPLRRILVWVGVVVVAGAVGLAYWGGLFGGRKETASETQTAAKAPAVPQQPESITVTEQQMQQIKLGKVELRSFRGERGAVGQII